MSHREEISRCVASVHIDFRRQLRACPFWRTNIIAVEARPTAGHGYPRRCCESTNSGALSKSNQRVGELENPDASHRVEVYDLGSTSVLKYKTDVASPKEFPVCRI